MSIFECGLPSRLDIPLSSGISKNESELKKALARRLGFIDLTAFLVLDVGLL